MEFAGRKCQSVFAACGAGVVWDASLKRQRPFDDSKQPAKPHSLLWVVQGHPLRTQQGMYSQSSAQERARQLRSSQSNAL